MGAKYPPQPDAPADGSVTDAKVAANAAIAESKLALASDAVAGTASRRSLGIGATQAAAGNDGRLSDQRTPLDGSVTNAKVAAAAAISKSKIDTAGGLVVVDADVSATAAIAESKLSLATDAATGTGSRRTLGTGATQAAQGSAAEYIANKGAAGGYASLDSGALVPVSQVPASASAGAWARPSPLGASARPAVDLLMSAYDTNPATTDHTSAFQSALGAAATILAAGQVSEVRIILDSRQKYVIGGAVSTGAHGENAQIALPYTTTWSGTIRLVGMPAGDASYIGFGGSHTVIESTVTAPTFVAANGIASIIGGPAGFSSSARTMSLLRFATTDVVFRAATPAICGIDAGWLGGFFSSGHLGFTTDALDAMTYPFNISNVSLSSAKQAIPIILPFVGNYYGARIEELSVSGWYCGPVMGEAAHIDELRVFATNLCLPLDVAQQENLIGQVWDWNNAHGIGTCGPSNTPTSPSATGLASNVTASIPAMLQIEGWHIQRSSLSGPAGFQRVDDVLDGNNVINATAWVRQHQGGTGALIVGGLTVIGAGVSATGLTSVRLYDQFRSPQPHALALPGSGVAIRNPMFRDAFLLSAGGQLTTANVDGTTLPFTTIVPVHACGVVTLTYSGSPTANWFCT